MSGFTAGCIATRLTGFGGGTIAAFSTTTEFTVTGCGEGREAGEGREGGEGRGAREGREGGEAGAGGENRFTSRRAVEDGPVAGLLCFCWILNDPNAERAEASAFWFSGGSELKNVRSP